MDSQLVTWIAQLGLVHQVPERSGTVAAYVPSGSEPGSVTLLEELHTQGRRILLPVMPPGPPAPMQWAEYDGPDSLAVGRFGIREPLGTPLPTDEVNNADLVLVPALAVDRRGVRLGRGAGYYDRTIRSVATDRLVAVVYDHEVLEEIPGDQLDVPVGWSLTPTGGFCRLGTT